MVYDFTLQTAQDMRISLGYNTTTNSGAANNTLLYIDHIRLLRRVPTAVTALHDKPSRDEGRYNLAGQRLQDSGTLPRGIYIINGRKMIGR
jgi:nucleosome binding factor SPN SPT16 subunit